MNADRMKSEWEKALSPHLPDRCAPLIAHWIVALNVKFKISRPRESKLGDFRPAFAGKKSQITVNSDLNPYAFLTTTVHEFAHLGCHLKHGNTVAPHGAEWKGIYTDMLQPFAANDVFPPDIKKAVYRHISNPKASSCSCPELSRALALYDKEPGVLLSDMGKGEAFAFRGIGYIATEKRRTRYLCMRIDDGKQFLISGRAKVQVIVDA